MRDQHNVTPDLEQSDAYAELVRMAVSKDPSLANLAAQHLQTSSLPRQGAAAQPPPAPKQSKAPWLRCADASSLRCTPLCSARPLWAGDHARTHSVLCCV